MARSRSESRLGLRTGAPAPAQPPCLLHVRVADIGRLDETMDRWKDLCRHAAKLGLNGLLLEPVWQRGGEADPPLEAGSTRGLDAAPADADTSSVLLGAQPMAQALGQMAHAAREHGLALVLEVVLDRVARNAVPATADPAWLAPPADEPARDPRLGPAAGQVVSVHTAPMSDACLAAWRDRLAGWLACGVQGFCFDAPHRLSVADWQALAAPLRAQAPDARLLAWTHGLSPEALAPLAEVGFDGVFSSLPWWDYRADWLLHEDHRLRAVAPVIAPVALADASQPGDRRALWAAAVSGDGMLLPSTLLLPQQEIAQAVAFLKSRPARSVMHAVAGQGHRPTVLVRRQAAARQAEAGPLNETAAVLFINWRDDAPVAPDWPLIAGLLPPGAPRRADGQAADAGPLAPAACACFVVGGEDAASAGPAVRAPAYSAMKRTAGQRLAIENVAPAVDDGAFAPKTPAGRTVVVSADLILDGHDELAGELRWRALDETDWHSVPLEPLGNDRWQASLRLCRVGRHEFVVAAWRDAWTTFVHELAKKHEAGLALGVEIMDGAALLRAAAARAQGKQGNAEAGRVVKQALKALGEVPKPVGEGQALAPGSLPETTPERVAVLRDPALARAMRELDDRPFLSTTPPYPLWVDRPQAEFASWYELFPRSQAAEPGRHGTFADVARRLPALRAMGFDVLYFPPIHPIGQRNRKGRNNSLRAEPGDLGSPYAIGAAEGGHDAVHPQLGTIEDFLALVRATREHGLEIALDFAIQCSPDHPWLAGHPEWFSRRADGSIRYAENPPKKYEDIVNVEFYGAAGKRARKTALWEALRDVVLFWVDKGVRIFRVDNPHTKPLPFWEWLIDTVQAQHPDVVFLSEAFTRPKMMYRLAKIGFTQSYTYFTWRHGKQELIEYLNELSRPPVADFFRPNFFVNTPDINPYFLQRSGRAGFLIRAALAATTSGLWGMYSGFELCESAPVPGKEEYLDSEKYELRQRDWNQPGNINAEIARLNLIRRQNPALQTHRGFHVAHCPNDQVLCFWKAAPGHANVVLVAISLDPHGVQHADIALSGWRGPGEHQPGVHAEDLLHGGSQFWQDEHGHAVLTPEQPYRIWRLSGPD